MLVPLAVVGVLAALVVAAGLAFAHPLLGVAYMITAVAVLIMYIIATYLANRNDDPRNM